MRESNRSKIEADLNDSELVLGLREQKPAAVRQLTDRFLPSLWRFVYFRVNGDPHLAEDIVSETVLALIRTAAADSEIEHPGAWLRSVASHKIMDHFRAAKRVQHLIDEAQQGTTDDSDNVVKQQELNERRAEIRQTMEDMPEQYRLALEWKYVDRLSVRDIAGRMETTEKSVEAILFRARREFRDRLKTDDDDEESPTDATSNRRPPERPAPDERREADVIVRPGDEIPLPETVSR